MAALREYDSAEAIRLLESAKENGPYEYAKHLELYESLGTAYAYAGRQADALRAFGRLLQMAPGHVIDYELSPKVTRVFQEARKRAGSAAPLALELDWARGHTVDDEVRIQVETAGDPEAFIRNAFLFARVRGESRTTRLEVDLSQKRGHATVPALAKGAVKTSTLELYAVAKDVQGNEILQWASPRHPREINLAYVPPTPWTERWWVWAVIGVGVVGSVAGIYAATRGGEDVPGIRIREP